MVDLEKVFAIIEKNELSQEEMEYVVESYIFEKKKIKVKIDINNKPLLSLVPKGMKNAILQQELLLLNEAYNVASTYFYKIKNKE